MCFLNRSNTNQAVQSQKQARSLKFRILEEEEVYYLCSENRGVDQLRICALFWHMQMVVFSWCRSFLSCFVCVNVFLFILEVKLNSRLLVIVFPLLLKQTFSSYVHIIYYMYFMSVHYFRFAQVSSMFVLTLCCFQYNTAKNDYFATCVFYVHVTSL